MQRYVLYDSSISENFLCAQEENCCQSSVLWRLRGSKFCMINKIKDISLGFFYTIGSIIFLLCFAFKLHFSSVKCWVKDR